MCKLTDTGCSLLERFINQYGSYDTNGSFDWILTFHFEKKGFNSEIYCILVVRDSTVAVMMTAADLLIMCKDWNTQKEGTEQLYREFHLQVFA